MQDKIIYATEKWRLDRLEEIYRRSSKAVFSAESERYGAVILKIDSDSAQLKSEYRMLARLTGGCAQVYAYEEGMGLLLEERILPGTVLRQEASLEKRIEVFSQVFRRIHASAENVPVEHAQCEQGETYLDWLEEICGWCVRNRAAEDMTEMAERARRYCAEMFEKYPDRMLLHGDLHHDNMLLKSDGSYVMIDPKGVVGPAVMDLPRYILNEIGTVHDRSDRQHMEEVIRLICERLDYPQADVRKLFFMETVLENVWCMESGEKIDRHEIELAISMAEQDKKC